ncbi:hypothetical protein CsSME_00011435 [Camellia sinensis var. sinensis]
MGELGLEILGISNAKNLSSIYSGTCIVGAFKSLNVYILTVFFKSNFVINWRQYSNNHLQSPNCKIWRHYYLWELPELTSIGWRLPSLQTLKVWECPKLQKLEDTITLAESLRTLWISNVVDLKNIYSGSQ